MDIARTQNLTVAIIGAPTRLLSHFMSYLSSRRMIIRSLFDWVSHKDCMTTTSPPPCQRPFLYRYLFLQQYLLSLHQYLRRQLLFLTLPFLNLLPLCLQLYLFPLCLLDAPRDYLCLVLILLKCLVLIKLMRFSGPPLSRGLAALDFRNCEVNVVVHTPPPLWTHQPYLKNTSPMYLKAWWQMNLPFLLMILMQRRRMLPSSV